MQKKLLMKGHYISKYNEYDDTDDTKSDSNDLDDEFKDELDNDNFDYNDEIDDELDEDNMSDSDYNPDDTDNDDTDDDDTDDDYDDDFITDDSNDEFIKGFIKASELGKRYRTKTKSPILIIPVTQDTNISVKANTNTSCKIKYNTEEKEYLKNNKILQNEFAEKETKIYQNITKDSIPLRFKIINSSLEEGSKYLILTKLEQFQQMNDTNGEYFKLKNWLNNVCMLPIQKYYNIPMTYKNPLNEIQSFMINTKNILDKTVYGHTEAKNQVMRIIAQLISNPNSHGHCIGIQGPAGIGKTTLVKEGIAKALNMPFGFIALGGASDGSFLEGHSFTYEGSTYGKIAEVIIKSQCMNPILFFDELDKVSSTGKGEEIIGILTHLTDSSQNEKFNDRYFGEIDLNLSRSIIVFSYNDESLINPILKDRMITINVKGYSIEDKCIIASEYMLPIILKNYGFNENDIVFNKEIIKQIIQLVPDEEGVRNLKRGLESIVSWINMTRYLPNENNISFPYTVTDNIVNKYIDKEKKTYMSMYT
jgi:ATP-dependent Lon protease